MRAFGDFAIQMQYFNPLASERRDIFVWSTYTTIDCISIHSPLRGETGAAAVRAGVAMHFNPLASERRDLRTRRVTEREVISIHSPL